MLALPGLVQLAVQPAMADIRSVASVQAGVETPKQMRGNSGPLPFLVDSSVTQESGRDLQVDQKHLRPPKGALALDKHVVPSPTVQRERPRGWIPRDGLERKASRPVETRASTMADSPSVGPVYPESGSEVDTLTPLLRADAANTGIYPAWQVEREYRVCETIGSGACTTSPWKPWTDPYWRVPAGKLQWGRTYVWQVRARDTNTGATSVLTDLYFTTGVRQPIVSSLLAGQAANGQDFHQLAGNYTTTVTDAAVATPGSVPLAVVRSYNSLDRRAKAMFGAGWSTRFDMKIESEGGTPESLLLTYPDGRQLRFAQHAGKNTYQPPPGMHITLAKLPAGGWKVMDKQSNSYEFDAQGRLSKVTDSRGRGQMLTYTDGKLTKVTAIGGRSLTFSWTGEHVGSVSTDPVHGTPLVWTYHYDGDRLVRMCAPGQGDACTVYDYGSASRYRETVLDDRPVHYFRLGEVRTETWPEVGTVQCFPDEADALGCTRFGSGTLTGQPGALAGTTNAAATFQGSGRSSHFELGPMLPKLGDQVTVESWFKTTQSGFIFWAGQGSWKPSNPGYGVPGLYVGTDGKLRGQLKLALGGESPGTPVTSPQPVNDGQWHHAVITVAGEVTTLYVDGASAGTGAMGVEDWDWLDGSVIGTGAADSASVPGTPAGISQPKEFGFQGSIDEVSLYDRALTAGEVRAHYDARAEAAFSLSKITLPSGRTSMAAVYDAASGRLSTMTDAHGGTWKIGVPVLDYTKRVSTVSVIDPSQISLSSEHDPWRGYRLVSTTDQEDKKTSYTYDTGGFLAKVTDPNGNSVTRANDSRGNVIATTTCRTSSSCQTSHTAYYLNTGDEFDPRNDRVVKSRDARSAGSTDNTYAISYDYDQYGGLIKETSPATLDFPNGRSKTVTYTDGNEPAVGGGTTPAGLLKTSTDAKGNVTRFSYNAAGDLAEQTAPTGLVVRREHDALGRLISQTQVSDAHPDGVTSTFTYDTFGRTETETAPGVKNEITGVTHTAKTTFTYDPDGNRLTETVSDLTGGNSARTTVYTYDDHGRPETKTDPEGGQVRATWSTLGLQTSVTDELGSVYGFTYTTRGELASRTLKNWTGSPVSPQPAKEIVLESLSYDFGGRLAARVDSMGRKTSYKYYADNRQSQVIADDVKLNGLTTTTDVILESNTYDNAGHLISKVTPGPTGTQTTTTQYVYDAAGRLTSSTFDPTSLKRKVVREYDANGLIAKETRTKTGEARAETVTYAYNAAGVMTRQTVENGDQDIVTTWEVDDRGLVTGATDPRGNADGATAADFTVSNRYDAIGRLIETKAPAVQVEKAGADAASARPTTRAGYDAFGNQTHTVDAEGGVITTAYDKAGRPVSLTMPAYTPPGGTAVTPTISRTYDKAGRLTKTVDPRGYATTTEYDALGNLVRTTDPGPSGPGGVRINEFDLAGEQLAAVDPNGARTQATYDDLGRKITQTVIERKPTSTAYTTTFTYNNAGVLTKTVAPGSKTTVFEVNAAGEIKTATDPAGNATTSTYDLAGRPLKVTDATGTATETAYDLAGRLTTVKELNPAGTVVRTTSAGYDLAGNVVSQTSGEGHTTRQTFDALNRLTSLIEPVKAGEEIVTRFGYDAVGARTKLTDGRGNTTWTGYNSLGLVENVIEPATAQHPDAADRTWTYSYDKAGNNTAILQPGGVRIDRTYDHLGRLTKEDGTGGGAATAQRTFGYDPAGQPITAGDYTLEYNDRGQLTKLTPSSGPATSMAYDANGNLTQRVDAAGTATFTWDNANRVKTASDPVTGRTWTYGYDKANRVTSLTSANPANTQTLGYDDLGRANSQILKSSSGTELAKITYGWDKDDNLTTKTTSGLAGAGTNTYGYDHAGRLTSWTAPGGAVTAYEWDAAGNRTKAGDKAYTYDERNRLTAGDDTTYAYTPRGTLASQTKAGATTQLTFDAFDRLIADGDSLYSYDVFDRLTRRISGTTNQQHHYSGLGNDLAAISVSGSTQARYARDPFGALLGLQEGTDPAVGAFNDLHGDLVGTYTGTTVNGSTAFDPFGQATAQTGGKASLGYQGEYTDPDTGKVNMHARWYQPSTGTFTSRDTATLNPSPSVQANRYTYANASPLTGADPTGHYTAGLGFDPGYSGSATVTIGSGTGYGPGGGGESVIGDALGGGEGALGCSGPALEICGSADFSAVIEADPEWYYDNFIKPNLPSFDDDEAKRIGVTTEGEPAQPGYWDVSKQERETFAGFAQKTDDEKELRRLWQKIRSLAQASKLRGAAGAKARAALKKLHADSKTPRGTREGDVCGGRHCTPEEAVAACRKLGYSKAQCAEKNWVQGGWKLFLKIEGVWNHASSDKAPSQFMKDLVSFAMDYVAKAAFPDYRYRFDIQYRDTMFIWRKTDSLKICLNESCVRYRMLYRTQWRTTVQTHWKAWVSVQGRLRFTDKWVTTWEGHYNAGRPYYTYKTWDGTPDEAYLSICKSVNESANGEMCSH
ncbi:hypothetical protein HII36_13790 [Nonomuraea sp. NN258]|uniref:LamG-like jellyroll fold domain-containing protein n=1 Tax=Nonomuraea antri TaxID=2730852 RepID=UPI0015691001|nr:RHS repeat-associated core domain-containing protein [Nonomuraea antri]NRQ32905.1 hypothetical protein [Nonomuraea antri]